MSGSHRSLVATAVLLLGFLVASPSSAHADFPAEAADAQVHWLVDNLPHDRGVPADRHGTRSKLVYGGARSGIGVGGADPLSGPDCEDAAISDATAHVVRGHGLQAARGTSQIARSDGSAATTVPDDGCPDGVWFHNHEDVGDDIEVVWCRFSHSEPVTVTTGVSYVLVYTISAQRLYCYYSGCGLRLSQEEANTGGRH